MNEHFIRESRGDKLFNFVIIAISTLVSVMVIYPLLFVVIASISNPDLVASGQVLLFPKDISLEGYRYIMRDQRIWTGYMNSIIYTVCGTLLGVAITIPGGYVMSRPDMPGKKWFVKYMVFTMYFSGGLIPTYLVVKSLGLVDTRFVLIILGSFSVYNLIIARTYFASTIPVELQEAADIDGCSVPKFFWHIVLPLSKPIIAIICLYYAVSHWNSFFTGLMYVNSTEYYPLQLVLRDILISGQTLQADVTDPEMLEHLRQISQSIQYGVIIISSLPVLMIYPFIQKYFVKGVMIGSLKG